MCAKSMIRNKIVPLFGTLALLGSVFLNKDYTSNSGFSAGARANRGNLEERISESVQDDKRQDKRKRKYEKFDRKACSVGFDDYGVSKGPISTEGVEDCGVCILVSPIETWMSHFGFGFVNPAQRRRGTSYIDNMVYHAEPPTEALLIGGDPEYVSLMEESLISHSIPTRRIYEDNVKTEYPCNERNVKKILIVPKKRTVYVEKDSRCIKRKY